MKNNQHAFTLIELLVVIAVIALLLSVIMPALNAAKRSAHTMVCSANMKSYGSALQAYAIDNDDKAPYKSTWLFSAATIEYAANNDVQQRCMWHNSRDETDGSLWPYMEEEDAHMCPIFDRFAKRMGKDDVPCASQHSVLTPYDPQYSYAMNWFIGFDWATFLQVGGAVMEQQEISMKLSRVSRTSLCFSFSEENLWNVQDDPRNIGRKYSENVLNDNALWLNANKDKPDGATDNVATYHNVSTSQRDDGKANMVFVDGHVETKRGLPGRDAYLDYGKPYPGHENMNVW